MSEEMYRICNECGEAVPKSKVKEEGWFSIMPAEDFSANRRVDLCYECSEKNISKYMVSEGV